jgi:hypothetical protein
VELNLLITKGELIEPEVTQKRAYAREDFDSYMQCCSMILVAATYTLTRYFFNLTLLLDFLPDCSKYLAKKGSMVLLAPGPCSYEPTRLSIG